MHQIQIADFAWQTTFPHRVAPQDDEWLPGLLLRCDELNHWESRTTLTHLLRPGPEKFHRCWRTDTPHLVVIIPHSLNLDSLAQFLAIPTSALLATTYQAELARLYETAKPHPKLLHQSYTFRLCPECLAEARILRRILTLPHITLCPRHQMILREQCQCGTALRLFHPLTRSFTCYNCGLDWANLPRIKAVPSHIRLEQKLLTWYEFFFSQGTPLLLRSALQLATGSSRKQLSLGTLVALLVKRGRFPKDLLNWMDRVSQLRARRSKTNAPLLANNGESPL